MVRNALLSIVNKIGLLSHLEPLNLIANQNIRPVDVMLPDFNGVDITIIGVVSLSHPTTMQSVANTKNDS